MATIREVLLGIETRLRTIEGLRVEPYVPGQVNPPQAFAGVPTIENYRHALGGRSIDFNPTVTVLVSAAVDRVGQLALTDYADPAGPKSIAAAIEGDMTLGGVASDCKVTSFQPLGLEEVGVIGYIGGVFTLRVLA